MATAPMRRVLGRLATAGSRRAQLSVAAYRSAFESHPDDDEQ